MSTVETAVSTVVTPITAASTDHDTPTAVAAEARFITAVESSSVSTDGPTKAAGSALQAVRLLTPRPATTEVSTSLTFSTGSTSSSSSTSNDESAAKFAASSSDGRSSPQPPLEENAMAHHHDTLAVHFAANIASFEKGCFPHSDILFVIERGDALNSS
jgi:hypothetical protein